MHSVFTSTSFFLLFDNWKIEHPSQFFLPAVANTLIALADGDPVGICMLQFFPVQQSISHSSKVHEFSLFK